MDTLKKVTGLKARLTEFDNLKFRGQAFCDSVTAVTDGSVDTVDLYTTMQTLATEGYRLVEEVNIGVIFLRPLFIVIAIQKRCRGVSIEFFF